MASDQLDQMAELQINKTNLFTRRLRPHLHGGTVQRRQHQDRLLSNLWVGRSTRTLRLTPSSTGSDGQPISGLRFPTEVIFTKIATAGSHPRPHPPRAQTYPYGLAGTSSTTTSE